MNSTVIFPGGVLKMTLRKKDRLKKYKSVFQKEEYKIRPLTVDNYEEYRQLRLEALKSAPEAFAETPEDFEKKTLSEIREDISMLNASGGFIIGAFANNGKLLGMIGLGRSNYDKLRHRGHVWGVYVTQSARGNGIGEKLIKEVVNKALKIDDFVQLDIEVVTTNKRALQLYQKVGFELFGTQPRALKVGNKYFDEHLLVLKLD